jgi:hypothetical protein
MWSGSQMEGYRPESSPKSAVHSLSLDDVGLPCAPAGAWLAAE